MVETSDNVWRNRASQSRRARWASWTGTFLFALLGGVLVGIASAIPPSPIRVVLALLAVAALLVATIYGTVVYMRRIDEQERDANLWGCYVGMCTYAVLYPGLKLAAHLGVKLPLGNDLLFLLVMLATLGTFCWKRFR